MKPEIKRRWVAALRSGKYKQGEGSLCTAGETGAADTYCCLGVLCDLHHNSLRRKHKKGIRSAADSGANVLFDGGENYPTDATLVWAGLTDVADKDNDVPVNAFNRVTKLSILNDGNGDLWKRQTFKQIAKIIEKQL